MSRTFRFLLLAALFVPLAACSFEAPAPKRLPPPPAPSPPLSTLSVSLAVSADQIAHLLDAKTEHHLADIRNKDVKCAIGRCKLTLLATREGPIETLAKDGELSLRVPFGIDADIVLPGFLSALRGTGNAEGVAFADTSARVTQGWDLRTDTQAHIELENSHVRFGPVTANLTDILNKNEEILSRPLSKEVDHEIERGVHLHDVIEKAWRRAFVPIRVGKKPVAWLVLAPESIGLSGPTIADQTIKLSLGLQVRARVLTQESAPATAPRPLPAPSTFEGPSNSFSFVVPTSISYGDAAHLAMRSLKKKPLHVAGMNVRVTKLDILPSRDDVVVAASFCLDQGWDPVGWFSSCGTGYLRGAPVYDPKNETIAVTHVHYDVLTEDVLLGAMRALAGPQLGQALESHLRFAVSRDLAKLRNQVAMALAKPQGRDVTISGEVQSFDEPTLTWTKDGFLAQFSARGNVHADLHIGAPSASPGASPAEAPPSIASQLGRKG